MLLMMGKLQAMGYEFLLPPILNNAILKGVLVLAIVLLISYYALLQKSRAKRGKLLAPEASCAWPIIGHLLLLGTKHTPLHKTLGAMAEKFGPVFNIRLGTQRALVVSSSVIARECFTVNDTALSSRPKLVALEHMGYNHAVFGFARYGPYWREIRKIATVHLFSNQSLEMSKHIKISEVSTSMKELYSYWNHCKESGLVLVDLKQWFSDLSLNVILRKLVGKRYSIRSDKLDEKEAKRIQKALRDFFYLAGLFVPGDFFPNLRWLDMGGIEKSMKKTAKELYFFLEKWLEEHKQQPSNHHDLMAVMLSVLQTSDISDFDDDIITKSTILGLILGGTDTTTVTLTWAISLLLNNPHVLKMARSELNSQIGNKGVVRESDMDKLVYIKAIVNETLRLYPAAPLLAPRYFTEDCTIGGYHVPKGTRLILNVWKIQTDPNLWPNPLEFKPERFLTTHKGVDAKGKHFEYIPFGSGRRMCPAVSLGLQMIQYTLASFLQAFDIYKIPPASPVDMTESFGLTNMKATPLEVLVKPRIVLEEC